MLSLGETIVTDRLHGMLIGLQMGRSVVAIDNNNFKLTKYADTWFGATQPDVRFANSFEDAGRLVG
jgi:pyruvyl transferase EpsO